MNADPIYHSLGVMMMTTMTAMMSLMAAIPLELRNTAKLVNAFRMKMITGDSAPRPNFEFPLPHCWFTDVFGCLTNAVDTICTFRSLIKWEGISEQHRCPMHQEKWLVV